MAHLQYEMNEENVWTFESHHSFGDKRIALQNTNVFIETLNFKILRHRPRSLD